MTASLDRSRATARRSLPAPSDRIFFTAMGAAILLVVFAGFAQSYYLSRWLPPPSRTPELTPLIHVHAAAFSLWILMQLVQPALVAGGRVDLHRKLGLAGAGLALAVWAFGNAASAAAMNVGYRGMGDPHAFYAITFFAMQAFAIIVALGILKRGRPETHKRLMLLANAAILEAAVGRLPLAIVAKTAPLSFYLGADAVILAGVLYDKKVRGRVHPVWIWGGGALVLSQVLRLAIMNTEPWLAFAKMMASLA